jgi:hypothetical protein
MFVKMSKFDSDQEAEMDTMPPGIMPSDFMRDLRPENYSDTQDRTVISLTNDHLEYRLETITARNQTHDFELFCRKLCERSICPNLRVQTGPEGGGDSKVDTESLPVAREIQDRFYEGLAQTGSERWAFAISAEKKWTVKARRDVRNIVETGRGYERIFFITSRHARAKDRARLEDELSKAHGIPVTIHDRTWIVDETIEKGRADLAYNFLNVGQAGPDSARLGPNDYSRKQQLEDLESEIKNPEAFEGMEMQLASETLVAAKLSRSLERPREETDGRFMRAIRLADKYGTDRQKLESRYEHIWTAHWWFNDFDFLLSEYELFEGRALESVSAVDLEWLGNLHQLLVNGVTHNHFTNEAARLDERAGRLESRFHILAQETGRPNNRLEARAGILRIRLNRAMINKQRDALPDIWNAFAQVVEDARGLGEFNFETLMRFIEIAGQVAGNDPAYNELIEKCAKLVAERTSESEAALMYLKRAKKLGLEDNFDMIRWLGKAAVGLSKQEYSDELIEATQLLALAYRSAGLMWAARASCAMATATMFIEAERINDVPVGVVPTVKLWSWVSIELWHLPDALHNIQLLNGFLAGLPLDDESRERVKHDLLKLDIALASLILNLGDDQLGRLERLPNLLGGMDLNMARTSLLYALGHMDAMRADGTIPETESDEDIRSLMVQLKNQPVSESVEAPLVLNEAGNQSLVTTILGMQIVVEFDGTDLIPVAEAILGSLEAFFATAIELRIAPHTEQYRIVLTADGDLDTPDISSDALGMATNIRWPNELHIGDYDRGREVHSSLTVLAGHVLATACLAPDSEGLLERLFGDEAVSHRIAMITTYPNSHSRLYRKPFSQLSDWDERNPQTYELKEARPALPAKGVAVAVEESKPAAPPKGELPRNHKKLGVRSVIDLQIWDQAVWRGCGYLDTGPDLPPIMALLFQNADAATRIFERWRQRFGEKDEADEIAISLIRKLPGWNPDHYIVQITSSLPNAGNAMSGKVLSMPMRSLEVTPTSSANLERFLTAYSAFGVYGILPGIMLSQPNIHPELIFDLAIEKHALIVKDAAEITEHDPEATALNMRGIPLKS